MNERIARQKAKAKQWATNMGMIPHKDNSGKLTFDVFIKDTNGQLVSRKRLVKGKLNPCTFLHNPTTGIGITKKYLSLKKPRIMSKPRQVMDYCQENLEAHGILETEHYQRTQEKRMTRIMERKEKDYLK